MDTQELIENFDLPQVAGKVRRDIEAWFLNMTMYGKRIDTDMWALLVQVGGIDPGATHGLFLVGHKRIGYSAETRWVGAAPTLDQWTLEQKKAAKRFAGKGKAKRKKKVRLPRPEPMSDAAAVDDLNALLELAGAGITLGQHRYAQSEGGDSK